MTDRQSTHSYTQPHPVPASDTLVLGAAKATSYGPRAEPYDDGIVEPAKSAMDADFWSVYEWRTSRHALEGGWWEWLADCDTEDVARTLAEAIAHDALTALQAENGRLEAATDLIRSLLTVVVDLHNGYPIRELHIDVGTLRRQAAALGVTLED